MSDFPQISRAAVPGAPPLPRMLEGMRGFAVDESVMRAAGNAPLIKAEGFIKEASAEGDVVRGMESLGGKLLEIGKLQAEMRVRNDELDAESARKEYEKDIFREMTDDPDETTWPGRVKAGTARARMDWMKGRKYSPEEKARADREFDAWEKQMHTEATVSSAQQTRDKYAANLNKLLIEAVDAGDLKRAHAVVDEMVSGGVIQADAGAKRKIEARDQVERRTKEKEHEAKQTARHGDLDRYKQALKKNPWEARALLDAQDKEGRHTNFPAMDEADRLRARAEADDQASRTQMREIYGKQGMLLQIIDGTMDNAAIEKRAGELHLHPDFTKRFLDLRGLYAERKAARTAVDPDELARLTKDIEAYDKYLLQDPQAREWGDLANRVKLLTAGAGQEAESIARSLDEKLRLRHPAGPQPGEDTLPDSMEEMLQKHTMESRRRGDYGQPTLISKIPGPDGLTRTYEYGGARQALYLRKQDLLRRKLLNEYTDHPDRFTTSEQVENWLADQMGNQGAGLAVERLKAGAGGIPQPGGGYIFPGPKSSPPRAEEFDRRVGP